MLATNRHTYVEGLEAEKELKKKIGMSEFVFFLTFNTTLL
jgi:hypothetical protein